MTLEELQSRVWQMIESRGMGTSVEKRYDKFCEEANELHCAYCDWLLCECDSPEKSSAYEQLKQEFADFLVTLLALGQSIGITNPTEVAVSKIEDTEMRYPQTS